MDELAVFRGIAALLVVLGLLGGLYWGLRRFTTLVPSADSQADLKVIAWRQFDGRRKLAVVRWGDEEHLILTGPSGDIPISSRAARQPEPVETED